MSETGYPQAEDGLPSHPAERLEAALERIARVATAELIRAGRDRQMDPGGGAPGPDASPPVAEIAARLDELILRLRAVLGEMA